VDAHEALSGRPSASSSIRDRWGFEEDPREGRMPEGEVIWLAGKLLDSESKLNVRYPMACLESMLGNDPQAGHILMGGAKAIRSVDGAGRHTFR
jgi:hypothetical protein